MSDNSTYDRWRREMVRRTYAWEKGLKCDICGKQERSCKCMDRNWIYPKQCRHCGRMTRSPNGTRVIIHNIDTCKEKPKDK